MLKFEMYNPDNNCNCVIRSLSKILEYDTKAIEDKLNKLAKDMNHSDYSDIEVFEKYMELHNILKIETKYENIQIKDIDFSNGKYMVFCWNKEDFYHLVTIINNVIYDKREDTCFLYPISIYKKIK